MSRIYSQKKCKTSTKNRLSPQRSLTSATPSAEHSVNDVPNSVRSCHILSRTAESYKNLLKVDLNQTRSSKLHSTKPST